MALFMIGNIAFTQALSTVEIDAASINQSGRQRMLSQRILYSATDYAATRSVHSAEVLETSLDQFETSHRQLRAMAWDNDMLSSAYFVGTPSLDRLSRDFVEAGRRLLVSNDPSAELGALVERGEDQLRGRLDRAVRAFVQVAQAKAKALRRSANTLLLSAVLVILLEGALIFWPTYRLVNQTFETLSERNRTKHAALTRLANFASIAADLFWETDLKGNLTYAEGQFLKVMKGSRENLIGCHYLDLMILESEQYQIMEEAVRTAKPYSDLTGTFTDIDGRHYILELSGMPRFDENGEICGYLGTADDISERQAATEKVRRLAHTDSLTGLFNKRGFDDCLTACLKARQEGSSLFLLAIDLDQFKPVNDTYGHGAGDEVLKIVAARINSTLREPDWAARIGGDEFFVVCNNVPHHEAIARLAGRLNKTLSEPYGLSMETVRVSASIGIACLPDDGGTVDEALAAADRALYAAKRMGRNNTRFANDNIIAAVSLPQSMHESA